MLFLPANMSFPGFNILNFRFGFATNSSSVHTLVFVSDNIKRIDLPGFMISTRGKARYLYFAVASSLKDDLDEVERFIKSTGNPTLINALNDNLTIPSAGNSGDFSPWWSGQLPFNFDGKTLCLEFFNDLSRILLQPDVALISYHDSCIPEYFDEEFRRNVSRGFSIEDFYSAVCRYNKDSRFWTIFDRETGNKIRGSFFPPEIYGQELLCDRPELADVKITNHCNFNCDFCYQNSSPRGRHAKTETVFRAIDALAELEVFEIAIGGGDPVDHPDFNKIVSYARDKGIIPNFSTRNLDFILSPAFPEIAELVGSIGYTITSLADLDKLENTINTVDRFSYRTSLFKVHIVENSLEIGDLMEVAKFCQINHLPIIFLGAKHIGRGNALKNRPWPNSFIEDLPRGQYEIDTQMASTSIEKWQKAGYNTGNVEIHEGLQSLYVDCCAQNVAKSSYQPETSKRIDFNCPNLSRKFQQFFLSHQPKIVTDEYMWLLNPDRKPHAK